MTISYIPSKNQFSTILADPPWPYKSSKAIVGNGGRGHNFLNSGKEATQVAAIDHYELMSLEDIKALPVSQYTLPNSHLYLWFTNAFAVEAHEVARAWGFSPKTIITWVKVKKDGTTPSMKTGYYYRGATEHILFCVRGSLRLQGDPCPTVFYARRRDHSRKPEESYNLIEKQSLSPFLELFARKPRAGWSIWGNEVESDIALNEPMALSVLAEDK